MRNEDGTITSIYCHWDGYPSWNGRILLENYTDEQSVRKLMELGDMSILGRSPVSYRNNQLDLDRWSVKDSVRNRERKSDLYGNARCLPYSMRGEDAPAMITTKTEGVPSNSGEEYEYMFENGEWRFRECDYPVKRWKKLTKRHVME